MLLVAGCTAPPAPPGLPDPAQPRLPAGTASGPEPWTVENATLGQVAQGRFADRLQPDGRAAVHVRVDNVYVSNTNRTAGGDLRFRGSDATWRNMPMLLREAEAERVGAPPAGRNITLFAEPWCDPKARQGPGCWQLRPVLSWWPTPRAAPRDPAPAPAPAPPPPAERGKHATPTAAEIAEAHWREAPWLTLEELRDGKASSAWNKLGDGGVVVGVRNLTFAQLKRAADGDWTFKTADATFGPLMAEVIPRDQDALAPPPANRALMVLGVPYCDDYHADEAWHGSTCWELHPLLAWREDTGEAVPVPQEHLPEEHEDEDPPEAAS